jgi:hypothetical protein
MINAESLKGRDHLQDLDINGRILEWILEKQDGKVQNGLIWLGIGPNSGLFVNTAMNLQVS